MRFSMAWRDWTTMLPVTTSPLTMGTWPETYSQPSASNRAGEREMLAAGAFAAFDAITLDAHAVFPRG